MRKELKYILLLLSIMTIGCTKENIENCPSNVNLHFRFTLHEEPERGNLFGENVKNVVVYIFDNDGILQQIETEKDAILTNDYVMSLDLNPGKYSILAWASDNDNLFNTHKITDINNNKFEIGKSHLRDISMLLETESYLSGVKPTINAFDDLYYGVVGTRSNDGKSQYTIIPFEVKALEVIDRDIELIRNTNIVRVIIEGTQYLTAGNSSIRPEDMLNISFTVVNTQYEYMNNCTSNPLANYFPQYSTPKINTLYADIKTEKLEWSRLINERAQLCVELKGGKILYKGDLIDLLRQARDKDGNLLYTNQEDLDRIYIHPIRFVISKDDISQDLYVKIFIHNWELVTLIPEI